MADNLWALSFELKTESQEFMRAALMADDPALFLKALQMGLDINRKVGSREHGKDHWIIHAVVCCAPKCIASMVDSGVDIEHQDTDGRTPLILATQYRNLEMIKMLLAKGADAQKRRSEALCIAADRGYLDIVQELLPKSNPLAQEAKAMRAAAKKKHFAIFDLLAPVSNMDKNAALTLAEAGRDGHMDTIEHLINHALTPDKAYKYALTEAAYRLHYPIIDFLKSKASPAVIKQVAKNIVLGQMMRNKQANDQVLSDRKNPKRYRLLKHLGHY